MAVPKFFEFFEAFLNALSDGEIHSAKDVRECIAKEMYLSEEDRSEMLPSGTQSKFDNRVAWARAYLDKAGLIDTPLRGKYHITKVGKEALESKAKIDLDYLNQFDSFKKFHETTSDKPAAQKEEDMEKDESPLEVLDSAFQKINATLASQLMDEVMKLSPTEFEKLVVKLLLRMGYGNGIDEAGRVTQRSKDGGIDGIIKEDQLGFSNIYIQAKQWSLSQTVTSPEVQKFVGALVGKKAQKGLFITTTRFSDGAIKTASDLSGIKVVLIDGKALMRLMIKHNLGISVEHVYEIKRIDSDFFADEL